MKKITFLLLAIFTLSLAKAQDVQLVVQKIDNEGLVPGNTYRVYAQLPTSGYTLHAVYGDDADDLSISSTAPFFQHVYGGQTSLDVNAQIESLDPAIRYDSWVTIGAKDANNNNLWDIGIDFSSFNEGDNLLVEDGAWFVIPTDIQASPAARNLVLIAQLTSEGEITGYLNFQGWDESGIPWQARGLVFNTENADVFGCTDASSTNYDLAATFDDGSCEEGGASVQSGNTASIKDEGSFQVFPNPIYEDQFNIQFDQRIDPNFEKFVVDIFDQSGKKVHSEEISGGNIIGGNRVIIHTSLASGSYTVGILLDDVSESHQIIVQK